MSTRRDTKQKPTEHSNPAPCDGECESELDPKEKNKGNRKPKCPEGYPDEQPTSEKDAKR